MKIIAIKDTIRKDVPIYYKNFYTGVVVIDMVKGPSEYRIDFTIEMKATGQKEIVVSFIDNIDYPLIPLNKEIKKFIDDLDSGGGLPID